MASVLATYSMLLTPALNAIKQRKKEEAKLTNRSIFSTYTGLSRRTEQETAAGGRAGGGQRATGEQKKSTEYQIWDVRQREYYAERKRGKREGRKNVPLSLSFRRPTRAHSWLLGKGQ
jgi:hypothetical protein